MFCLERKYMIKRAVLLYLGLACVIPLQGHGANPIDTQEQLDRARASQEAREARLGEERIQWQHISSNTDGKTPRPASGPMSVSPSFYITQIRLAEEGGHSNSSIDNSAPYSTRLIKGPLYYQSKGQDILLDVPQTFSFLRKEIKPYINRKLSIEDINGLSTQLTNSLLSHGFN